MCDISIGESVQGTAKNGSRHRLVAVGLVAVGLVAVGLVAIELVAIGLALTTYRYL